MIQFIQKLLEAVGLCKVETFCTFSYYPYFSTKGMPGQSVMVSPASVDFGAAEKKTYFGKWTTGGSVRQVAGSTVRGALTEQLDSIKYRATIDMPWAASFIHEQIAHVGSLADKVELIFCKETGEFRNKA